MNGTREDSTYTEAEREILDRVVADKRDHAGMSDQDAREWAEEHSALILAQARLIGDL